MADEEMVPFDPLMKKKKKKKKTGFDPDAAEAGDTPTEMPAEEPVKEEAQEPEPAQEKAFDDELSLEFGGQKKKKKKKKVEIDMADVKEALPDNEDSTEFVVDGGSAPDADSIDLSFGTKKKKKSKVVDLEEIPDAVDDAYDAVDSAKKPGMKGKAWVGSDRDYSYDELLTRVFDIIREKNPEMATGEKKKIVMRPPQVLRAGAKRTSFANFAEISRMLHRQSKHVLAFLLAELGT
ncbi:hypothetical protein DPMN_177393, partial [Dreissena polymorpha]